MLFFYAFFSIFLSFYTPIKSIEPKFTDRIEYYKAFDEYHVNNNIGAMENLFARYIKERLDMYLNMLK